MNKKVTIGITSYNRPQFLDQCINSVRSQTYRNLDIIIWDDASSDPQVKNIIYKHKSQDSRITVIIENKHTGKPNRGRNFAILLGRGEYCSFIDDDDYYKPIFVEKMLEHLGNSNTFAYSLVDLVDNTGKVYKHSFSSYKTRERKIPLSKLEEGNGITLLEVMFKKSLLLHSGIFDERLPRLMDWDLWLRLYRIATIQQVWLSLSYVRHHTSTRITTNRILTTGERGIVNPMSFIKHKPKNLKPTCYPCFSKYPIDIMSIPTVIPSTLNQSPEIIITDDITYPTITLKHPYTNTINIDKYKLGSIEEILSSLPTIIAMGRGFSELPYFGNII